MAKAPTPRLGLYEASTAPRPTLAGDARPQDVSSAGSSIAQSLARAGGAVQQYNETQLDIERRAAQRREDDARIDVTRRMSEFRRAANDLRRQTFEAAPDGWRNATESYAQGYSALRDRNLGDATLTAEARTMFEDQLFIFEQSAMDAVAEQQESARGQWQADATRQAVDAGGSVLVTDPDQYEAVREDAIETVGQISDANLRRDTMEYMEESYARYAVGGLIQRDPRGTLRDLNNPEAEGAIGRLSPAARAQAIGQAEVEIERRAARWRAQVSQQVQAAQRMFDLGIPTDNAPSVETVRQALGPEAALAYEASREASTQFGSVSTMTTAQLTALASDVNPRANEREAVLHMARRQAAAATLQQRIEDPMQYQVRHGMVEPADLLDAFNRQDWGLVNGILQNRSAGARENAQTLGTDQRPLTTFEANVLGPQIRNMSVEQRGAFMRSAAAWMGPNSDSYRAMMGQLFPDGPATAYAGYLTGTGERGAADAQLILRGEEALGGRSGADGENGGGSRSRLLNMPQEDDLREAWTNYVGDAYRGMGPRNDRSEGLGQAEAQSYEAFRAAYAGLIERNPQSSDAVNASLARRAAQIATGGVVVWNGRETLTPAGMSATQFQTAVRDGFSRYDQLRGVNPRDYNLMPLAITERGTRYGVFDGDDPVRSPSGRPVEIEVRRR
jgi:hypothetical protein